MASLPLQVFVPTPESEQVSLAYLLTTLPKARVAMAPAEFRTGLRQVLLDQPQLKLSQIASVLGVTRQRVSLLVGKLDRPSCAHSNRLAPKREAARQYLTELAARVRTGEPAAEAAKELGISLGQAMRLGFRVKEVRPPHGTQVRLQAGCNCWRCRRAGGIALARGRRVDNVQVMQVRDWLAWVDPDDGVGITQAQIGQLVGVGQPVVSRIVRAVEWN